MANHRVPKSVIARAIAKAGDHVKLAKHLSVTYQAVNYWRRAGAPSWRREAIERFLADGTAEHGSGRVA